MKAVRDIAKYLLLMADRAGEQLTNMKLQKLLYYQQGYHLAYFGTPLFEEDLEAWMYGPVVPSVYFEYEEFERKGIPGDADVELLFDSDVEARLFDEVFRVYNRYSAYGLMEMTHNEKPWLETSTGKGNVICKDLLRSYFAEKIK